MPQDTPKVTWLKSREISERIVVEGLLVLDTPASLSNGDADGDTDISLITDPLEGWALLTGTSIAGALRNYLRERSLGYAKDERERLVDDHGQREELRIVTRLFGSLEDDGEQSPLIIDDALQLDTKPEIELRDGVKIDKATRTAEKGKKFDLELLEAGSTFPLRFELLIANYRKRNGKENDTDAPPREKLIEALATALQGFEKGEILLGGRKRRGYGQGRVTGWAATRYDLKTKEGLLAWLSPKLATAQVIKDTRIASALKAACALSEEFKLEDKRSFFKLTAQFALEGSLLIRSGSALPEGVQPDTVHLRSNRKQDGQKQSVPIVSGTSLCGVLRHRATRIAKTIASETKQTKAEEFVEHIFGVDMEKLRERNARNKDQKKGLEQPFASRLEVRESIIESGAVSTLIQSRVRIDRFTGGAYEGALFDAAPVFGKDGVKALEICLLLRSHKDSEIGLLLLLLKDLWTSDLAIGGESNVGRGRLRGLSAQLECRESWSITIEADGEKIKHAGYHSNDKARMEFLNALVAKLNEELN